MHDQLPRQRGSPVAPLNETHARKILTALDALKAVDPACGSGAYLLGLLHELVAIYRLLYSEQLVRDPRSLYELKLRIISQNLYGVDIDPFATNIAMLRLWLSLAVEAEEPIALPNLDFKIETGDSLLGPCVVPKESKRQQTLGYAGARARADILVDLKAKYLESHGADKQRYLGAVIAEESAIARELHTWVGKGIIDWRIQFADVMGRNDGFDIVVGNPPYVRQELIKAIKPKLKGMFSSVFVGTADLYCYFYARAVELLRPGGMLTFISSNKWFRAAYDKKLRRHVANGCRILSITDFGELPVFQNAATFPMIFISRKCPATRDAADAAIGAMFTQVQSLRAPYPSVADVIQLHGRRLSSDAFCKADWVLVDADQAKLLRKMATSSVTFGEYINGAVFMGLKTGFNTAFVIDDECRDRLISDDPNSIHIIRPLAVGDDVRRWNLRRNGKWLIVTHIGIEISRYKAVFDHLKQWQSQLESRRDQGNHWWELRACAYYDQFTRPKIVFPEICKEPRFAFDSTGAFINNKGFIVPSDDRYLLGVLNSAPAWEYAKSICAALGDENQGGRLMLQWVNLRRLPIPVAGPDERAAISRLVDNCIAARGHCCEVFEQEIDARVSGLYGLS